MKFKMNILLHQSVAFDVQVNIIYIYLYYMNNSRILTNNNYTKETRRKEIFVLKKGTRFYVSFCILVKQIRREKVRKKFCNKSSLLKYLLQMYTIFFLLLRNIRIIIIREGNIFVTKGHSYL